MLMFVLNLEIEVWSKFVQELVFWPKEIISVRATNSWVRCVFVAHYTKDQIIVIMMMMIVMIIHSIMQYTHDLAIVVMITMI